MSNLNCRDHYTYWVYGVLTVMLLVSCVPVFSREDTVSRTSPLVDLNKLMSLTLSQQKISNFFRMISQKIHGRREVAQVISLCVVVTVICLSYYKLVI